MNPSLVNGSEFIGTVSNLSVINRLYLIDGLALVGPSKLPLDIDFNATSFASHTKCRVVTSLCGANSLPNDFLATQKFYNFKCDAATAGLNLSGNFWTLATPLNDSVPSSQGDLSEPMSTNNFTKNEFALGFQYYNDPEKKVQIGANFLNTSRPNLYWGVAFALEATWSQDQTTQNNHTGEIKDNTWAYLDLVRDQTGGASGIMSCETNVSEIVRIPSQPINPILNDESLKSHYSPQSAS